MSINFTSNFENSFFELLFKKYNYQFSKGDIIAGKVISFEKFGTLIDIGAKVLAYLPSSEISSFQAFLTKQLLNRGELLEFVLTDYRPNKKTLIISLKQLKSIITWQRLKELIREDLILSGQVKKSTKQGKLIILNGLKGFVYGERGVWRPGDNMFITFILEDKFSVLPNRHPVTLEFYNPQGQLVKTETQHRSINGFYHINLKNLCS